MFDSLLYQYGEYAIVDTTAANIANDSTGMIPQTFEVNFLQSMKVSINPLLHFSNIYSDTITYTLLLLLGIITIIWYFLPDRFLTILSLKSNSQLQRTVKSNARDLGVLIAGVFWLNFILSIGLFILLILEKYFMDKIAGLSQIEVLTYIFLSIGALLFYRFVVIYGAATIFQTQKIMKQQVFVGRNIVFIVGVFLVPLILIIIYTGSSIVLYATLAIVIFSQLYRLALIVIIGRSNTIFSILHIILYLCTLEIVPVLVLVRLIGNGSVI